MSKTKKAEQILLKAIGRKRTRINKVVRKHKKLPMTFGIWNLISAGRIKRVGRGLYQLAK
jgi:hypothetical protein